jgi:hypothetical protein
MAGSNGVFNNQKGRFRSRFELPNANDAILIVLLEASGLEADDTLNNYDDLAALLAAANNEQTNQARKSITAGITITVDDTNNRVDIDIADQVYTALGGNAIGKLLACYDPDTMIGIDSIVEPLTYHSFDVTPDGSDVTAVIDTAGLARAA